MYIKNRFIKSMFKIIVTIMVFECIYLFALPSLLNKIAADDSVYKYINNKSNANIEFLNPKFQTHIKPDITINLDKLIIQDKQKNNTILNAQNLKVRFSIFDLLRKRINVKYINSQNVNLYISCDEKGIFNFETIFSKDNKSPFHTVIKNNEINIDKYNITFEDKQLAKTISIDGSPFITKIKKNKTVSLITQGDVLDRNDKSGYDINLKTNLPFSKKLAENSVEGKCLIYNADLDMFAPYIKKYIDSNIKTLSGDINYFQLSTEKDEENKNKITINTTFNNLIFDKKDWVNHIIANGDNTFQTNIELEKNAINVKDMIFKAKNININAYGCINTEKDKPRLDINAKVENSRAENIASILPPNLVPQYKTIEKVKNYGVYGDIEADIKISGYIPQPDITGYVKGRNVHILDKSIHNLHKGTIDINFDKRILNMDILVDLFDNQKAKVNGYVYMFRDGINNVTVKTTDNIDFPLAQKIIIPISKVFNFQLGPIPEMDIKTGKGIIDINVKGSMDFVNINGYSYFHDASLFYNGLYGKVEKGIGRLDFKEDVVSFKSEKAYVKSNLLDINGKVKINDRLDFTVSSPNAEAKDLLEFINGSSLLKDVKDGLAVITDASGLTRISVNMKAKIVPVPFGHPPLPPEEAFEDMKVKGSLYMLGNSCYIEGFYTPIEKIKGIVDFTETLVNLNSIQGISGTSPITITGQIINDLETKIPDIDITITSKEVKLRDTIKFLTESYLYPENYPDLSNLYKIASKHDLYFKYKAKSIDFETDKAYAVMNFIPDNEDTPIKAKSGKIIMDKATVTVDNIKASLYDSDMLIHGKIFHVDTLNPIYNLGIQTNKFNLENLNDTSKINILPLELKNILDQFSKYKGIADIHLSVEKNMPKGHIFISGMNMIHKKTNAPFAFDDFYVYLKDNKILINNMTAKVSDMPLFGNLTISDYYSNPRISGYFTSKLTNNIIKIFLDEKFSQNLKLQGDIGFSSKINGTLNNILIEPKLILNQDADVAYGGINVGDVNEKREFSGKIHLLKDEILINNFEYIKYILSQNNKTNPVIFANASGKLRITPDNIIEPIEFKIKTNKNLPARILNILLKTPVLKQGTFNCDLQYKSDISNKKASLKGNMDCRNMDIPLFDTLVKHISINADNNIINLNLFGYVSDSKIKITSEIENNLLNKPKINLLNIYFDKIDRNKLFDNFAKIHKAMNTNNEIKNIDLSGLTLQNGHFEIKELIIKSLVTKNFTSDFSIDKNGILTANNMTIQIGQGNMKGTSSFDPNSTQITGEFELNNVDANYIAETLFEGKNQIYGNANGKMYLNTKGSTDNERIKNLSGLVFFDISDGRMPKLGSLEYLLRASNIIKSGITGFSLNNILELLNIVKTGYFSNIHGGCTIENGIAKDIEIYSKGENMSLYIHGNYDISKTNAELEILGKLSKRISTIFGKVGNASLNTFFRLIPGISMLDFGRKDFIEDVEKIPSFTTGDYESRIFQAIIDGNINESGYVQSFKWVK